MRPGPRWPPLRRKAPSPPVDGRGGRAPVSAALGEVGESSAAGMNPPAGLQYVKWGLSGLSGMPWQRLLSDVPDQHRLVAVAYADWVPARAPRPGEVVRCAIESNL